MLSLAVVNGVYEFIRAYQVQRGYPPTYEIISRRTGLAISTVRTSLDKLEAQGKLYRDPTKQPVIQLISQEAVQKTPTRQLHCAHCQVKLTGGRGTFDRVGIKVCASCYLNIIDEQGFSDDVDEYQASLDMDEWFKDTGYSPHTRTDER